MRIGWIDYLNTLPFDFKKTGFDLTFKYDLIKGVPSQINSYLSENIVDIGFISSAHYIENYEKFLILPELSISSLNKVRSVVILSDRELSEIEEIYLTKESKTSRYLTKVIFEKFLGKKVRYLDFDGKDVESKEAVLLIGDNAIMYSNKKKYIFDLSSIWYKKTGLPFVFALWSVREDFFNKNRDDVLEFQNVLKKSKNKFFVDPEGFFNLSKDSVDYLKNLDYCLSEEHIKSLEFFSNLLLDIGLIVKKPEFRF
ncbi:menaquinone biosynthetic enzyme MqnA/MqnD family protein, partial [Persephonella sp.]